MSSVTIFNDPIVADHDPDWDLTQQQMLRVDPVQDVPDSVQILREREHLGRKFGPADLTFNLTQIAYRYLDGLNVAQTSLPFLRDVAVRRQHGRRLSEAQVAGVLNCYAASLSKARDNRGSGPTIEVMKTGTWKSALDEDDRAYEDWLDFQANGVGKGTYTVVLPMLLDRVTVRLGAWRPDRYNPAKKMRWISFRQGASYTLYAKQSEGRQHVVLPRMRGSNGMVNTALSVLMNDPDEVAKAALAYAIESGRCARCDRELIVPASIAAAYGPECVKYVKGRS